MRQETAADDRGGTPPGGAGADRCPRGGGAALPLHVGVGADMPWSRLRERHGGLVAVEISPGVSGWLLLGYKENLQVLRDQTRFSADPRPWSPGGAAPARSGALAHDGEEHRRLRTAIVDTLARVGTPQLVPVVERAAVHLLDRVAADGSADLIGRFAAPLPALVLNELFGLPDAYGHLLADLTLRLWSGGPDRAEHAAPAIRSYFRGLVARKRADPGEDVASWLLAHPNGLTDDEAVEALSLLWETGHEPTTHLIGNALLRLLEDPNVWTAYLGGTLTPEDLVDYVMWTEPPIRMLAGRYSTTDVRFAGARIRRGDPLLLGFAAAHTDPSVSRGGDDAMALAGNRSHLSWGAGAHRCPATGFARELVRTAIDTAVDRLRGMLLAVGPEDLRRRASLTVHGLVELPVWFTATGERAEPAEPREERAEAPVRRRIRRKRGPAPRGARYQAPLARGGTEEEQAAVESVPAPAVRPRRRSPQGVGARYQAPFAREEVRPDSLEKLLATWRSRE
ncbi:MULTISPECIES: cytochrome P450 family protein [Nocardiopsis]|uniref:Cytochrome n=1 Tax=Nocardiopsis sinuspersici TaxID=501010 RepID=A0A1V3C162_9ACTN|nr:MULTISPECIES: cytochrome P450 [Nocardiopsis]OOC54226.1 cytochrome [Nocardiopsis sinuspersici]